jgi:hypothetical protein
LVVLFGVAAAFFVVIDPLLVHHLPSYGSLGKVLRLYPYELTSLFFLFIIVLLLSLRVLKNNLDFDKSYVLIFLLALHVVNLTRMGPVLEASDFVVGFFALFFIMKVLMDGDLPVDKALVMLNVAFICSILPSGVNGGPSVLFVSFAKACKLALLSFLLSACIYKKNNIRFFVKWFLVFAVVSSVIALLQQLIFKTTGELLIGLIDAADAKNNFEVNSLGRFYRCSGFVSGYKFFSNILVLSLILILNFFLYDKQKAKQMRTLLVLSSGIMFAALFFTFSKDALLILFLGVLLSILWKRPYLIVHLTGFLLFAIPMLYVTGILEKLLNALNTEITFGEFRIRRHFLTEGLDGFFKHPWIGVGINKSKVYTSHFFHWPPHNGFIVALDEAGFLGLIVFLAIIGYIFYKSRLLAGSVTDLRYRWIMRGMHIGFITFVISMNFHPTYMDILLWIYLGAINAMYMYFTKPPGFIETFG